MISCIHTADLHFGVENYGRIEQATGIHSRLLDFERAFNTCITFAIDTHADLFVIAGDVYKTPTPTPTHQKLFARSILRLHQAQIPVIMVIGNHDLPLGFGKTHAIDIFRQLPLGGLFVIDRPHIIDLTTKNGPLQIVGMPWPSKAGLTINSVGTQHDAPASGEQINQTAQAHIAHIIRTLAQRLDPAVPAILVGHLTVSEGLFSGSEKCALVGKDPVVLPADLALEPFDYVALGHLHRFQQFNQHGHAPIVYSGSIERIDFGERTEKKGFCHVHIPPRTNPRQKTQVSFIEIPTRPFVQVDVTLTPDSLDHTDMIIKAIHKHDIREAVIKIVYRVPVGVKDRVDRIAVERACATAWHITGIFPLYTHEQKIRRIDALTKTTSGLELIKQYIALNYPDRREQLMSKINRLYDELSS